MNRSAKYHNRGACLFMNKNIEERKITYITYLPVVLGVLAGSLFFFIMFMYHSGQIMGQGLEDYKISGVLDLPTVSLLFYILKRRMGQLLLFVMLLFLSSYSIAAFCYCFFFGAYYGIVICSLLVKFGINGLVYGMICFFPHYLIYFVTIYLVGKWFCMIPAARIYTHTNVNKMQNVFKCFVIVILILAAIIWEIKFQKNFLNSFYQYLV